MTEALVSGATVTEMASFRDQRLRLAAVDGAPVIAPAWALPSETAVAPPTGTVTFLLTDIEGSTPRWDTHPEAMAAAVHRHYEILDAAVVANGGFRPIEQGEGDSLVAAFPRTSDAAAAALAAQRALVAESWPEQADVHVRMALHTGEAQLRDGLYYAGPSIIRCARLRSLAHGDQVLLSAATADLLADVLPAGATMRPLGRYRLKGLRTPEEVHQLGHPDLPSSFPPPAAEDEKQTNVPIPLTSFVGRHCELDEIADLMHRHRVVSLVGAGGCGKTRLAAAATGAAVAGFADGAWWVELAEVTDPDLVPTAVLAGLGLDAKGMSATDRLTGYLEHRRMLLVLDNCEQIVTAAAALVCAVLRTCPEVRLLVTSREPLGVPGEATWRIAPLSLPPDVPAEDLTLDQILAAESVQLFGDRAGQVRPSFRVQAQNAATVAEICRRLDGIPLAVELAAARIGVLTPERILDSLGDNFRVLTSAVRGAPARQQTLNASVAWSHDLLTEDERALLRRLAVFVGGFDLEAAEQIAAGAPLHRDDVLPLLANLVDKSLVTFDGEHYHLLSTIRDFATERLGAAGEVDACRDAHLTHYLSVAAEGATQLAAGPQVRTLEMLEAARANLLAAADWALTKGDCDSAAQVATDLTLFWQLHGRHAESLDCLRRVLAAIPETPTPLRARVLWAIGQLAGYAMDLPHGYGVADTTGAIEIARGLGCDEVLGRALGVQGFLTAFLAPAACPEILAQAREAAVRAGDPYGTLAASAYAAFAAVFGSDRRDLAARHLAELTVGAGSSPLWSVFHGMASGIAHWRAGEAAAAVDALQAADDLGWAIGDPTLESWCVVWLAEAHIDLGDFAAAERVITRSAGWMDRSSLGRHEFVLSRRIRLEIARGNLTAAAAELAVFESMTYMGFPLINIEAGCLRAAVALGAGDSATARASVDAASDAAAGLGTPWYLAMVANAEGRVARAEGRPAAAEDAHHRALALCVEHGFSGIAAETLECLAALAVGDESWSEAGRLFGAAAAQRGRLARLRPVLDARSIAADLATIEQALGAEAGVAALEGAALSLIEAADYAARARGARKRPTTGWDSLTPTELTVVGLVAQGLTNATVAQKMFIAEGTVKIHLHHVFGKLGITRRAELAVRATERRLGA